MDLEFELQDCLRSVDTVIGEATQVESTSLSQQDRTAWVVRQAQSLGAHLRQIQMDLEAGASIQCLGFNDLEDLQDLLNAIKSEASMLMSMLQMLKSLER